MGSSITAVMGSTLHELLLPTLHALQGWRDDAAVILLGSAAALFLVAGVVRLARWRLAGDVHCALAGSALIVMGGLYVPLVGIAEVGGALHHRDLGEALLRALVTFIAAGLVLGAVRATAIQGRHSPGRLLPALAAVVLLAFAALAGAGMALADPLPRSSETAQVLSAAMALTWLVLAVVVRRTGPPIPWSHRTAPLFGALAVAEALYGHEPGAPLTTGAALVVCTLVAGVAVWSASDDLAAALHHNQTTIGSLSETLSEVRDEAGELTQWRAHLVHDATNAVAGLKAALDVLGARQGTVDPAAAHLCDAANEEVRHLDHLLHRTPDAPVAPFDAAPVVRSVGLTARALGQDVSVTARTTWAVGRPGDLVVVLKNLLANTARHAPGAPVHLGVEQAGNRVRIVCRDHGPGVADPLASHIFERGVRDPRSDGSGLGLYGARMLMREQGGDLVLERVASGARFVATLPAARPARMTGAAGRTTGRRADGPPEQRRVLGSPHGSAR